MSLLLLFNQHGAPPTTTVSWVCTAPGVWVQATPFVCTSPGVWAQAVDVHIVEPVVTFRAAGTPYADFGAASATVEIAGVDGDLMLLVCTVRGDRVFNTPSGWTLVTSAGSSLFAQAVFSRIRQAGDVDVTVTWTTTPLSGETTICQTFAFQNGATATPGAYYTATNVIASIGPVPGVTLPENSAVVVIGGRANDWGTITTLGGDGLTWTQLSEVASLSGDDAGQVVDSAPNNTGSDVTVTNKTWVCDTTTSHRGGVMVVISP